MFSYLREILKRNKVMKIFKSIWFVGNDNW